LSGLHAEVHAERDPTILKSLEFLDKVFTDSSFKAFNVKLWDGTLWQPAAVHSRFTLELKHPGALRRMFWAPSELSLGEAYIYGDFDVHGDLEACFELSDYLLDRSWRIREKARLAKHLISLPTRRHTGPDKNAAKLKGAPHSKKRDAQAISYHYNVSNDFYRLWLDERMVYSCAYFHTADESLEDAQRSKLDYICRKLRLKPGERLLDIGCGWGGLIIHAAQNYGVDALGITLSQNQADLANQRISEAGLADHCLAKILDYRDVDEREPFDKMVSVGMFEHVGESQLATYFQKVFQVLKPGGVFLNHGITESMQRPPQQGPSFIDKYVFPDGELMPITTSLRVAEETGFEIRDLESLREHYAMTLRHWVARLQSNRAQAVRMTSEEIYRIWNIYMAGSAYGFETGVMNLYQALMIKPEGKASPLPLTRCDWYKACPIIHAD
jgi:cyclopropane-fatty-acyl-phospholipid synthase